jgi:hypothetical protein
MAPPPASDKAEPFKSLLAAWSLAVVVVAVAGFSLDNELTVDAIRAGLLIWVAFHAGGVVGYRNHCLNVDERTSRLPRATVVFLGNDGDVKPPFACDANSPDNKTVAAMPTFVGDAATMLFNASGAACSSPTRSWRLLCRNLV